MAVGATNYPSSLDTLTTLIEVVNASTSTIGAGGVTNSATTVPVTDTTAAPSTGVAWCGAEAFSYTAKTGTSFTGCTRHIDGTATEAHSAGDTVYFAPIIALHHRVLSDAIIAIETLLGAAGVNVKPASPDTSLQFNNAGAFAGTSSLLWNASTKRIEVTGGAGTFPGFAIGPTGLGQYLRAEYQVDYDLASFWASLDLGFQAGRDLIFETVGATPGDIYLTPAAGKSLILDGYTLTPAGLDLLDDADAAAQRTTLGLVIGTNVQAYDADLTTLAGLTATTNNLIMSVGSAWASRTPVEALAQMGMSTNLIGFGLPASTTISVYGRTLVDDADAATARATLAAAPAAAKYIVQTADTELSAEQPLGALATGIVKNTTTTGVLSIAAAGTDYYAPAATDVAIADGGTGQSTKAAGFDALSPLTSAADVLTHDGADNIRLAKGGALTYLRVNSGATALEWGSPSGSGDVVGPGSAVDNQVARYDGTTGKLLQTSGMTIGDDGYVTIQNPSAGSTNFYMKTNGAGAQCGFYWYDNTASKFAMFKDTSNNWGLWSDAANAGAGSNVLQVAGVSGVVTIPLQMVTPTLADASDTTKRLTTSLSGITTGTTRTKTPPNANGYTNEFEYFFRLTANGGTISTIANFFGSTSAWDTVTNGVYLFEAHCYFLNTTAGTLVWTLTNTQAYTNIAAEWRGSAIAGMAAATPDASSGGIVTTTTAGAALPTTGTLATAVNHLHIIRATIEVGTAGNIRLNATKAVGGTITPLRGSWYSVRRMPAGNFGTFTA